MSFDINAKIRGDNRDIKGKLKEVEEEVDKIGSHFKDVLSGNALTNMFSKGLKLVGLGAVAEIGKELADKFNERVREIRLDTMRTGLDAQTVQKIQNLESATDAQGAYEHALIHTAEKQQAVKDGGESGAKALENFAKLGVSAADVQSKSYQELTQQVFKYLGTVEVTGEKIAALREIFGRSGPALIPAAKMGMDSNAAEKGLISDEDLESVYAHKKAMSETNAIWADMTKNAGHFFSMVFDGVKELQNLPKVGRTMWGAISGIIGGPRTKAEVDEAVRVNLIREAQQKNSDEMNARRIEKENEASQFDEGWAESLDQYYDEEAKAKEKASKEAARMEAKVIADENKRAYNAMSPEQKQAYVADQIAGAKAQEAAYLNGTGDDPREYLAYLQARHDRGELEDQLAGLNKPTASKTTRDEGVTFQHSGIRSLEFT